LDDKILTSWNALMIAAMCHLYRVTRDVKFLNMAIKAETFIENKLYKNGTLYISYREGKRSGIGFLDDYANMIFALLALYEATLEKNYLEKARRFCRKVIRDFYDTECGGFYLYGKEHEQLILRPKETYDGAVFSGNSVMTYNLVQLYWVLGEKELDDLAKEQIQFMSAEAERYPAGYAMFLIALSDYMEAPEKITIVVKDRHDIKEIPFKVNLDSIVCIKEEQTEEFVMKNDKTTFYICKNNNCYPPINEM